MPRRAVSFKDMKKVIGGASSSEQLEEVFAEFDEEAVAAASIGQVYRARLPRRPRGGREGAVPRRGDRPCAPTSRTWG